MKHIIYSGIILFLGILLFRAECGKPSVPVKEVVIEGKKYEVVRYKTDTQYIKKTIEGKKDTVVHDTVIYVKVPILDSIQLQKALEDYHAKKVYKDTISFGSGTIYLTDTIHKNKIANRSFKADVISTEVTNEMFVKEKPKNGLYFGPRIDFSGGQVTPHVGILFRTKKERIYGVSLGVGANGPIYSGSLHIKL